MRANVFSVATEGKDLRYGSIRMPIELWGPWRHGRGDAVGRRAGCDVEARRSTALLRPSVVLDILANFTALRHRQEEAPDQDHLPLPAVRGRQQDRRSACWPAIRKKGLIWHFQGSGKSLLMVFAAQKLRLHPALRNPTVLIVVDRIDLDTQITATFNAADVPNLVKAETREELEPLLRQDVRKIIITTIHKFAEADGVLNERSNIIVMVDEAHRTQEGDLGRKMREALPNAFLFGLTGTPINQRDRNTFWAFGADEDEQGYMSRYGFEESIRDKATLPLHFEPRLVELQIDKAAIDEAYAEMTGEPVRPGPRDLRQGRGQDGRAGQEARSASSASAPTSPTTSRRRSSPTASRRMVVTFDRESCVLYKAQLDELLPPEASEIVISVSGKERDDDRYQPLQAATGTPRRSCSTASATPTTRCSS